jgi:hypothetical protein
MENWKNGMLEKVPPSLNASEGWNLEGWNLEVGIFEGWKNGKEMEGWKVGKLEVWKVGIWNFGIFCRLDAGLLLILPHHFPQLPVNKIRITQSSS